MNASHTLGPAFRAYAKLVVFVAVLLVWWGAATTTKQAGMVFADWPLSLGTFNPPGWLEHMVPFLEHSHRLLAKLVGFLVLGLFCWSYVRSWRRALEVLGLVLFLALVLAVFIVAGSERFDSERKAGFLTLGLVLSLVPAAWLAWSWARRGWSLVQKLSALALLMVTTQAILGGMRVTEISDAFAVVHGCFAQAFFCVLLLIVMVSGRDWADGGFRDRPERIRLTRLIGLLLVVFIGMQLAFGAFMRHYHRSGVPDDGLFQTMGHWIPPLENPVIVALFLHKFTATCILLFVIGMAIRFGIGRSGSDGRAFRFSIGILALITAQIVLGLSVIGTEKSFWVTNVHVLNGLAILGISFVFSVLAWRGAERRETLAQR